MTFAEFIDDNTWVLILFIFPVLYIISRDIVRAIHGYREKKFREKELIESEQRMYELIKESDQNKEELVQRLKDLKDRVEESRDFMQSEIDKQRDEEEKKGN